MNLFYDPETGTLYMMGTCTCCTGILGFSSEVMDEVAQTEISELERLFNLE